ncbi:WcaG Nucleoside-diphosphate-sugar epimerases [Rhabdaerophilaceae bacterium]
MTTLILGASGFVGQRLLVALAKSGEPVIAALRRPQAGLAAMGVEQRVVDACDPVSLAAAVAGVQNVVNCVMADAATMVASTRLLVEVAGQAGCQRLVHFSSTAVYADREGVISEANAPGGATDAYGAAKIDCETAVRAATFETVILRPALIYGPGSTQWTDRIGRLLLQRRLGDLGPAGDGVCNLIYIDDVVSAAMSALQRPEAAGRSFNLAEPAPPTWNRYLMDFARALGATPVHRLPGWQLKFERKAIAIPLKIAEIVKGKLRLARLPLPDAITPSLARLFSQEIRYSPDETDRILRLARTPYADGVLQSAQAFLASRARAA